VQALHRARERLVAKRTALINQMRALLLERGIVLPQRRRAVAAWVDAPRDESAPDCLSPRIRLLVVDMRAEWAALRCCRLHQTARRAGSPRYSAPDPQAAFGRGEDPDRAGSPARRGQHRRAVPP
jgi:hypothetical protein